MLRKLTQILSLLAVVCLPVVARNRVTGFCEAGNQVVITPGSQNSTTKVQRSYPACTITVYQAGTLTPATIYSDNTGTSLGNPFTAATNGLWFFYADNGRYDVQLSGAGLSSPYTLGDIALLDPLEPTNFSSLNGVLNADDFPGSDCGARINAAYAALPSAGGVIVEPSPCTYSTGIVFGTNNKPVILQGHGDISNLTYTGSGTAVWLNYGTGLRMGHGLRDITLTGPGHGTATIGLLAGGFNGAQGYDIRDVKIQGFGVGFQLGDHTWIGTYTQGMIRDNGMNVLFPHPLTEAGENMQFNHVTFADAPSPHTDSVVIRGTGQEVDFTDCSFDQAQLHLGNGSTSAVQVNLKGTHFENPNFASGVDYTYVLMDNNNGNYLSMSQSFFEQDRQTGGHYANFMDLEGGKAVIMGLGMFTPAAATVDAIIKLGHAVNVDFFSLNDLSGNAGNLFGGSTTGYITSFPGTSTATTTGFNALLTIADQIGAAPLTVDGNIKADHAQLVSTLVTGTQPISVNSTTPVQNLFANPLTYAANGTQNINTTHIVNGTVNIGGGGITTVTLIGSAAYANSSSFNCTTASTQGFASGAAPATGSTVVIHGTAADNVAYICIGI